MSRNTRDDTTSDHIVIIRGNHVSVSCHSVRGRGNKTTIADLVVRGTDISNDDLSDDDDIPNAVIEKIDPAPESAACISSPADSTMTPTQTTVPIPVIFGVSKDENGFPQYIVPHRLLFKEMEIQNWEKESERAISVVRTTTKRGCQKERYGIEEYDIHGNLRSMSSGINLIIGGHKISDDQFKCATKQLATRLSHELFDDGSS